MKEHYAPQGTEAWKKARAGCITGSNFKMIRAKVNGLDDKQMAYVTAVLAGKTEAEARDIAGYKAAPKAESVARALKGLPVGDFSDVAKNHAFGLAIERISGEPLMEGYTGWAAERGHELEPFARIAHMDLVRDVVREVGFISTDDGKFGASADGFRVLNGNGCEYKCFLDPEKLRSILLDGDLSTVMDQCMGGLWLSGAEAWEFGLYCPALAPIGREFTLHVIKRDDDYIEALEADLWEFEKLVSQYEVRLRGPAAISLPSAAPPWQPDPAEATPAKPTTAPADLPTAEALFS